MLQIVSHGSPATHPLFPSEVRSGIDRLMDGMAREHEASSKRDKLVDLLRGISGGDREAFTQLYRRTSAKIYGICLRLLGGEAEAQEVLQEVYAAVWQKADRFDPTKASPVTWLAVLARNKAIDRLRRRAVGTDQLDAAADIQDENPSAFDVVADAQDAARLGRCLDELEDRTRAMIKTAFLDGATYRELAERERVPLATMKSWIRRGLQRLRGCLEQ